MMRTNVEERTSILLKGAWFETSFHNNRLFIYSNNTTCFLKILLESKSEHFITGKFLRYTGDRQKGSAHVFKSVGSWAAELHRALPVLCGFPAGGRPGQHSVLRGLEGIRSCPYQVTLPSQITPCSLLLSFPSLSFFLLWFSRVITGWDFCHTQISDYAMWTQSLGWVDWNCRFWEPHPRYPELCQRTCISRFSPMWHGAHQLGLGPADM